MDIELFKKHILDLAVRGKLVPQDNTEEPASELIKAIKKEKEQLIADKKIKKDKPLPEITEEEKPFDIPKSWEWVRLGEIATLQIGKTPSRHNDTYWINGKYNWVSIADIVHGSFLKTTKERVSALAYNEVFKGNIALKGSLLMSFKLSIGKMCILEEDAFHNEAIINIKVYNQIIKLYLFRLMGALNLLKDSNDAIKGKTLNSVSLNNIVLPLPPLSEQKRIVEKVDLLFSILNELDNNKRTLLENITLMRNSILDLAVRGKLVPQDATEEPASELIKAIKKEKEQLIADKKIKKEKPLPVITEAEKPFDIPKSWEWVRLGEVVDKLVGGGTPSKANSKYWNGQIFWASVKDLKGGLYLYSSQELITIEALEQSSSNLIPAGTIIISTRMGLGKIHINMVDMAINQDLKAIFLSKNINKLYFINYYKQLKIIGTGTTVSGIKQEQLLLYPLPLPPLSEQKRIVEKVNMLMKICDELEEHLKVQNEIQKNVLKSVQVY